jgi:hypothetical protein
MDDAPNLTDLNLLSGWEWSVSTWAADELTLIADTDLSYHHQVEITFSGVNFVSLPADFYDARFGAASTAELAELGARLGDDPDLITWAIDAEPAASTGPSRFFVRAIAISIVHGTVFHYWRDQLQPGERIAPWVKPPPNPGESA